MLGGVEKEIYHHNPQKYSFRLEYRQTKYKELSCASDGCSHPMKESPVNFFVMAYPPSSSTCLQRKPLIGKNL